METYGDGSSCPAIDPSAVTGRSNNQRISLAAFVERNAPEGAARTTDKLFATGVVTTSE